MRRLVLAVAVLVAVASSPAADASVPWFGTPVSNWQPLVRPIDARAAAVSPLGTVLYVVDSYSRVLEYSTQTGAYLGGFASAGTKPGQLNNPDDIAVDPYGDIWIADTGNGRVQKFSAAGKPLLSFDSPQPIGVAAGQTDMYVLSGLFRGVGLRTWDGKDDGAFIATFPQGFSPYPQHYGSPTNTADAIAADAQGNAVVEGTVSQALVDGERPACKSPLSTLPPLPDPLVAPAVTKFDSSGTVLNEGFPYYAGAICWTDNSYFWSYGGSGVTSAGDVAVDPATGTPFARVNEKTGQWWVWTPSGENFPIWEPRDGSTIAGPSTPSTSLYGPLRTFAIGCDSTLYLITDQRIQRIPSTASNHSLCTIRSHLAEIPFSVVPAVGGAPPPGNASNSLTVGTVCHGLKTCTGTIDITVLPCPKCRPIADIRKVIKAPPGVGKPLTLHIPTKVKKRLSAGKPLLASAHIGKAPAVSFPLHLPASVKAQCGGAASAAAASASHFTVSGNATPARRGTRINVVVTGPTGDPMILSTRTDARGRYSIEVPLSAGGAWTASVRLPGTRTRYPAQASCGVVIGQLLPELVQAVGPSPRDVSEMNLALACPPSGTAGQQLTVTGTLKPPDGGVAIALSFRDRQQTVQTGDGGGFATSFTPDAGGDWTIAATAHDGGADLAASCTVPVDRQATTLSIECPNTAIPFPGSHAFGGQLSPTVAGAKVTVTFSSPGQTSVTQTGTVDSSGAYSVDFSPPQPGNWKAQAAWPGDAAHGPASSAECSFMVG